MSNDTLTTEDAKELAIDEIDAALNRCGLHETHDKAEMCLTMAVSYVLEADGGSNPQDRKAAFLALAERTFDAGAKYVEAERDLTAAVNTLVRELSE